MKVEGRSEYSTLGKAEWIPIVSSFVGFGRLIHSLYRTVFQHKETEKHLNSNLKGRVNFWNEEKRGTIALIPIIGNAWIIWHDCRTHQQLNKLEEQLRNASTENTQQNFENFPEEIKESPSSILDLVKINPEILKYSKFKDEPWFMKQVAEQNIKNLKYAPESMMSNKAFILTVIDATDLDLFAEFPQLIEIFSNDPKVMLEMAKRNLDNLKYAKQLMNDAEFVLQTAKDLYDDAFYHFGHNRSKRPKYANHLEILAYAPELCKNKKFLLKAKSQPYLNPIKYADHHVNDKEFILEMMVNYSTPGGWLRKESENSFEMKTELPIINQTLPLTIASEELLNDVEFMKQAIEIDGESWKFASKSVQEKILADQPFLQKNCNSLMLMMEAIKYNQANIDLVSHDLRDKEEFKNFLRKNLPAKVYDELYNRHKK